MLSLCNGWEFVKEWTESFGAGEGLAESVRLPHSVSETPLQQSCRPAIWITSAFAPSSAARSIVRKFISAIAARFGSVSAASEN